MQLIKPKTTAIQLLAFAFLSVSVFTACKKEDDHNHDSDTNKPVITISSPLGNKVYNSGDTIRLFAKISDESLHELLLSIKDDSTGTELFRYAPEVHDLNYYELDTYWVSKVNTQTTASVVITAEDHHSNVDSAKVSVFIKP